MKIAVVGYGNLGRAVCTLAPLFPDLSLVGVYTRRDPARVAVPVGQTVPLLPLSEVGNSEADCLILAGSSDADLPVLSPDLAAVRHIVDSFDTHKSIPAHLAAVGARAKEGGRVAVLSAGWDPGVLSLARLYARAFMPYAVANTFWGEGVSQGHSAAVRHLGGVLAAKSYTCPSPRARLLAEQGVALSDVERHTRRVCLVAEDGADRERLSRAVRRIPSYFAGYRTELSFMSAEEFARQTAGSPHRGEMIASGRTGRYREHRAKAVLALTMEDNPEFTAAILLASARAALALAASGASGAFTFADIPPKFFLPEADTPIDFL